MVIKFKVNLDSDVYASGDLIEGELEIETTQDIYVKGLRIRFEGYSKVKFEKDCENVAPLISETVGTPQIKDKEIEKDEDFKDILFKDKEILKSSKKDAKEGQLSSSLPSTISDSDSSDEDIIIDVPYTSYHMKIKGQNEVTSRNEDTMVINPVPYKGSGDMLGSNKVLLDKCVYIFGLSNTRCLIHSGSQKYSFSFTLPLNLPSSFHANPHARIFYQCTVHYNRALMKPTKKDMLLQQIPFKVIGLQDMKRSELRYKPLCLNYSKRVPSIPSSIPSSISQMWDDLQIICRMPTNGLVPQCGNLPISVEVMNSSNRNFIGKISFIRELRMLAHGHEKIKTDEISSIDNLKIGGQETDVWFNCLTINDFLLVLHNHINLKCSYKISIEIQIVTKRGRKDFLNFDFPVHVDSSLHHHHRISHIINMNQKLTNNNESESSDSDDEIESRTTSESGTGTGSDSQRVSESSGSSIRIKGSYISAKSTIGKNVNRSNPIHIGIDKVRLLNASS